MNLDNSVAIVGGGPCGLMTALLLARSGIKCTVFEKRSGISTHPKAMGISRRTCEIFRQLGLLEAIGRGSLADDSRFLSIWAKSLVGEELGRVPFAQISDAFSPCFRLHCPQTWTEKVLLDAVMEERLAEIRFNCEAVRVELQPDLVQLSVSGSEPLTFPWLVAADGAGSPIRHQLQVETAGPGDMGHFLNVLFRANYGPYLQDRPAILYPALSSDYFEHFVAVNGTDLWLMHHFLSPGEGLRDFPIERMQQIVAKASGLPAEPVEILSIMPWVMSPKVAERFRIGRALLVGDAAARLSPAGGLGLNTGLQAAHNLAWKLTHVVMGHAADTLLDTYQEERRSAAFLTMQNTNRNSDEIFAIVASALENNWDGVRNLIVNSRRAGAGLGQDLGVTYSVGAVVSDDSELPAVEDPINDYRPSARPGSRAPHLWIEQRGEKLSTLDLFRGAFILLTAADFVARPPITSKVTLLQNGKDFTAEGFEKLYGIAENGAVLVRPDGYVGARWRQLDENFPEQLESALVSILRTKTSRSDLRLAQE
jgi:putative polyketide hydroxylase